MHLHLHPGADVVEWVNWWTRWTWWSACSSNLSQSHGQGQSHRGRVRGYCTTIATQQYYNYPALLQARLSSGPVVQDKLKPWGVGACVGHDERHVR